MDGILIIISLRYKRVQYFQTQGKQQMIYYLQILIFLTVIIITITKFPEKPTKTFYLPNIQWTGIVISPNQLTFFIWNQTNYFQIRNIFGQLQCRNQVQYSTINTVFWENTSEIIIITDPQSYIFKISSDDCSIIKNLSLGFELQIASFKYHQGELLIGAGFQNSLIYEYSISKSRWSKLYHPYAKLDKFIAASYSGNGQLYYLAYNSSGRTIIQIFSCASSLSQKSLNVSFLVNQIIPYDKENTVLLLASQNGQSTIYKLNLLNGLQQILSSDQGQKIRIVYDANRVIMVHPVKREMEVFSIKTQSTEQTLHYFQQFNYQSKIVDFDVKNNWLISFNSIGQVALSKFQIEGFTDVSFIVTLIIGILAGIVMVIAFFLGQYLVRKEESQEKQKLIKTNQNQQNKKISKNTIFGHCLTNLYRRKKKNSQIKSDLNIQSLIESSKCDSTQSGYNTENCQFVNTDKREQITPCQFINTDKREQITPCQFINTDKREQITPCQFINTYKREQITPWNDQQFTQTPQAFSPSFQVLQQTPYDNSYPLKGNTQIHSQKVIKTQESQSQSNEKIISDASFFRNQDQANREINTNLDYINIKEAQNFTPIQQSQHSPKQIYQDSFVKQILNQPQSIAIPFFNPLNPLNDQKYSNSSTQDSTRNSTSKFNPSILVSPDQSEIHKYFSQDKKQQVLVNQKQIELFQQQQLLDNIGQQNPFDNPHQIRLQEFNHKQQIKQYEIQRKINRYLSNQHPQDKRIDSKHIIKNFCKFLSAFIIYQLENPDSFLHKILEEDNIPQKQFKKFVQNVLKMTQSLNSYKKIIYPDILPQSDQTMLKNAKTIRILAYLCLKKNEIVRIFDSEQMKPDTKASSILLIQRLRQLHQSPSSVNDLTTNLFQ